jgi:hypothetical protein
MMNSLAKSGYANTGSVNKLFFKLSKALISSPPPKRSYPLVSLSTVLKGDEQWWKNSQ